MFIGLIKLEGKSRLHIPEFSGSHRISKKLKNGRL